MDAKSLSLLSCIILTAVLFVQRRVVFSWSTIGVFCTTNIVIIVLGSLSLPFVLPTAQYLFPAFDWSCITDEDLKWTIILNVGGAGLILLFYQLSHYIYTGGTLTKRAPNLLVPISSSRLGFALGRLFLLIWATLLFIIAFYLFNFSIILHGILEGMLGGNNELVITARYAIMENYLFILVIYNVAPFLAVALWLVYSIYRTNILRFCAIAFNIIVIIVLILLFQKRPLILFLLCLCIARISTNKAKLHKKPHMINNCIYKTNNKSSYKKMLIYGSVLFMTFMGLLYAQTSIGRNDESLYESVTLLVTIAALNIIGSMSVPSVLQVHYFPSIEPYYGFSNIKLLSSLLNSDVYPNTKKVFQYFSVIGADGSIATPVLMDFYGSFGLTGWFLGAALIGILLHRLDGALARMQPNVATILLTIFMFVFAFYLSHASLANSLLGYGGGIFVLLWIALKIDCRIVKQPVRHTGLFRSIV